MEHKMSGMTAAHAGHYGRFLIMIGLSFVAMYVLMYAMVDRLGNAVPNLNQAYMAGLMTAPMVVLELLLMGAMYSNKKWNLLLLAAGATIGILCWVAIRQQTAISDQQFLKSMIPHHAGAILMCDEAKLRDPDVKKLCTGIVASQQAEIDLMKAKLAEMNP